MDELEKQILKKIHNNEELTEEDLDIIKKVPELKSELEKLVFIKPPPTAKQFLDPKEGWLPESLVNELYDTVIDDFVNIVDSNKYYHTISIYGCTRQGKSYLARLLIFYTVVFCNYLKSISAFYNVSPITNLSIFIASFKYEKVNEIYLSPLENLFSISERMIKCTRALQLEEYRHKYGVDFIPYITTANKSSHINFRFPFNVQIASGNKKAINALGSDLIQVYISEISYFVEVGGINDDEIFRFYTDTLERIQATVGKKKLAFSYLDTSAYTLENRIEDYIWNKLRFDKEAYFVRRSRWDIPQVAEKNCPKWKETGKTFKVFIGDTKLSPVIIHEQNKDLLKKVPQDLVFDIPIDYKKSFERNLHRSICDILGMPVTSESKIFYPMYVRAMFKDNLRNIESYVLAESIFSPEGQIWDQVKDYLFEKYTLKAYKFYLNPKAPRYIGLDIAASSEGDMAAISCVHPALSKEGEKIFVVDFSFAITAKNSRISLEAIQLFIRDLLYLGELPIRGVSVESNNSEQLRQFLSRWNIKTITNSMMPRNVTHYYLLVSLVHSCKIISGKNIFLKNNLLSLSRRVEKKAGQLVELIDHTKGELIKEYDGDFEHSKAGKNAKDVSDSLVQAILCYYNLHNDDVIDSIIDWYSVEEAQKDLEKVENLEITTEEFLQKEQIKANDLDFYLEKRKDFILRNYKILKYY